MRVRSLAAALGAAVMLCTAAPARADVEELGRTQYLLIPGGQATAWEPPSSPNPNQTWIVGISQPAGVSTASLTYGDRALTLERAVTGPATRTEFWSLTNPEQVPGRLFRLTNSADSSPRISLFRFAGVDTTAPVLATAVSQGSGPGGQTALTGSGTPSDVQIGLFAHANGATSTGLGITTPDGAGALGTWNLFSLTPMRLAGMTRRGPQQGVTGGMTFSWTVGNALDNNWSAALIGLRSAPSTPTLGPVSVTTPAVGLANLTNTVTGDGRGGAVTARGFVLCQGCATPTLGAAGSTDFRSGTTGVGTVTNLVTTLARGTAYTVRAYATNAQGTRYSAALPFTTIANTAPTASAGGPYSVIEGGALTLAGAGADADSDPVTFAWDLDDDGDYDDATGAAPALTATRMRELGLDNGPLTRQLRVRVSDGFTDTTAAATLTVNNANPTGSLANRTVAEGTTATIGFTVVTDASPGDVTAGLRYAYDFQADGTYDVGSTTYAQASTATTANLPAALTADGPATRNVRVAVVDRDGGFTPYNATVTVTNTAPSATLANNGPVGEGTTAQVSWAGVTDPSPTDAAAIRYGYDFGNDGSYEIGGGTYATASPLVSVNVPAALTADNGTIAVRAVVIDKDGGQNPYTTTITVNNVAPTGNLANNGPVGEGATARVSYSAVSDAPTDLAAGIRYGYDFGNDGTFEIGSGSYATASPLAAVDVPAALTADNGTVAVRAVLIDKDGGLRPTTTTVTVNNVAPTATISGPDAVPSSGAVTLQVAATDPGGDAISGTIDWGDGTTAPLTLGAVAHTYTAPGTYTVTVRARDEDGGDAAPVTHALSVAAAPAAPAPTPAPVTPAAVQKLTIGSLQVTPRCIRAANLRALTAQRRTVKVRFNLSAAADVRLSLERWTGKRGAKRCPTPTGKAKADGRRIPGVYSPHSGRAVAARSGTNTLTLAATGRRGTRLRPGTYLVTVRAGDATARVKVWVLAG